MVQEIYPLTDGIYLGQRKISCSTSTCINTGRTKLSINKVLNRLIKLNANSASPIRFPGFQWVQTCSLDRRPVDRSLICLITWSICWVMISQSYSQKNILCGILPWCLSPLAALPSSPWPCLIECCHPTTPGTTMPPPATTCSLPTATAPAVAFFLLPPLFFIVLYALHCCSCCCFCHHRHRDVVLLLLS